MTTHTVAHILGRHRDADVYVVGSGTSLAGFDFGRLDGRVTVALNDAANAPGFTPTYHLWADAQLYLRYIRRRDATTAVVPNDTSWLLMGEYGGGVVTYTHVRRYERRKAAACDPRWPDPLGRLVIPPIGVGEKTDELVCNHTIATTGIMLAWKLGARRIFLLGVDAFTREPGGGGNYFDGRRATSKHERPVDLGDGRWRTSAHVFWDMEMWALREWFAERGHYTGPFPDGGVYNCSQASTLTAWEKVTIEEAIETEGGIQWPEHSLLSGVTQRRTPSSIS